MLFGLATFGVDPVELREDIFSVDYFELPVMIRWAPMNAGRVLTYVLLGPALGIRINCTIHSTTYVYDDLFRVVDTEEDDRDCPSDLSRALQVDVRGGVGMGLDLGTRLRASFDVEYSLGLTDLFEDLPGKSRALLARIGLGVSL